MMQSLDGRGVPEDELRAAISAATVAPSWGVDLLDLAGDNPKDISADVTECTVLYNGDDDVHRAIQMTISHELDWSNVKVRPWQEISGVKFYQGVFTLVRPKSAEADGTWKVQGYDPLAGLGLAVGDSYTVAEAVSVTGAARAAIDASGIVGAPVSINGTKDDVLTPGPMVWPLVVSSPATWLRVVNDLLTSIAYRGIYADELGTLRSEPYVLPQDRPAEWTFDRTAAGTDIVSADVTVTVDNWNAGNWWRGVRQGLATRPAEGDGMVTLDLSGTSQKVRLFEEFDAADQESLVSQFNAWIASQTQLTTTIDVTLSPLPILGHRDIVRYIDADRDVKCQIRTWEQDLAAGTVKASLEVVSGG